MKHTHLTLLTGTAMALLAGTALAQEAATVAFLMPDQASTRYEEHDYPGFQAEMAKLCADCTVIYQKRQCRRGAATAAVQLGSDTRCQGHRAGPRRQLGRCRAGDAGPSRKA